MCLRITKLVKFHEFFASEAAEGSFFLLSGEIAGWLERGDFPSAPTGESVFGDVEGRVGTQI